MAEAAPLSEPAATGSLFAPFSDPAGGSAMARTRAFLGQPPVKKTLPWFAGVAGLGAAGLLWASMAPAPQRTLYSQLSDSERADVTSALDKAGITYRINPDTGSLSVGEDDVYKARMLVASNGALAQPETGQEMLDKLPMGASRMLEGERVNSAHERELELTIKQIDGVESVRVHLAESQKSVFVRDNLAPTASVMVRLANGRQLGQGQVQAIINLVSGSVPGLVPEAVKVVDQHGRLLSAGGLENSDRIDLQTRMEDKLRRQVSQLLAPMVGAGNFSSEIQVELDMNQQTSARESYDKNGVVRSESQQQSQNGANAPAVGVPGVLSNTPPPPTAAQSGAPQGTPSPAASTSTGAGESSSTRTYELGREVAVTSTGPGGVRRMTVAVALSDAVMKKAKPAEIDAIKQLVSSAVGANPARGDVVTVITRPFEAEVAEKVPFYEAPWFAMVVRNAVALLAVLLVLLLGVRPMVKALKGEDAKAAAKKKKKKGKKGEDDDEDEDDESAEDADAAPKPEPEPDLAAEVIAANPVDPDTGTIDPELLQRQIGLAQRLAEEQPDNAVLALRKLLKDEFPNKEAA